MVLAVFAWVVAPSAPGVCEMDGSVVSGASGCGMACGVLVIFMVVGGFCGVIQ